MSSTALAVSDGRPLSITETRMTVGQLIEQRKAIVEVMESAMRKDIDYGIVPGTPKPSLYKPGSEKILSIFHLGIRPRVEDLSTPDTIRYRVITEIFSQQSGVVLGEGIGEASSAESKYQWRGIVCEEEWNATPDDRRRLKWKKSDRGAYAIKQIRADMEDVANTILKMAKKRSQIDAVLTVTAASDIFAQDLEDLKAAGLDPNEDDTVPQTDPKAERPQDLQKKTAPAQQASNAPSQSSGAAVISEDEGKRFWAVAIKRTNDFTQITAYLKNVHGVSNKGQILKSRFAEAMKWAETGATE